MKTQIPFLPWTEKPPLEVEIPDDTKANSRTKVALEILVKRGANLGDANLRDANLRDANLRDADLSGANLSGANLRGADLRGADLYGADLLMKPVKGEKPND